MLKIEIQGKILEIPTSCKQIKLSSYIEFDMYHRKFVEAFNNGLHELAYKNAVDALKAVIVGFDEDLAKDLLFGEYSEKSRKDTIAGMLYLVYSTILSIEVTVPTEDGYFFDYKDKRYYVPMFKDYDGNINPKLKYGQYIEALETMRVCSEKSDDPNVLFSQYLRILSASVSCVEKDCSAIELRKCVDQNAKHFSDIDMQTGLDVYFFLGITILN